MHIVQVYAANPADKSHVTTLTIESWQRIGTANAASIARANPRAGRWILIATCVLIALLSRLCYLVKIFDADGAMFIYMGKLTAEGGRLCHDLIDNKFPSVGLMTSAAWRLFGPNWAGYVILGIVLSFTSAVLLGRIARRHTPEHAVLPVTLFAIVFLNFNPAVFGGFQLETMQIFFAVLAAGPAMEALAGKNSWDAFVVGLAAGCAAMLKPTGLAVAGAFAAALMWAAHHRSPVLIIKMLTMLVLGLCLPLLTVLVYLIQADILRDMPALVRQISVYARESAWSEMDLFKPPTVALILGFPFLVRGWIFRRPELRIEGTEAMNRAIVRFVILWFILELAGVVSQRRMYAYHFLVIAPPAALLFGMIRRRDAIIPLAAALAPIILLSLYGAANVVEYEYRGRRTLPASEYLLAHASSEDAVWQDQMMRLLIETDLRPGSRLPMTFLFANHDDAPAEYAAIILADFDARKPKYILLRMNFEQCLEQLTVSIAELDRVPRRRENFLAAWRQIKAYVDDHYRVEAYVGRETVYRRRD